MAARHGQFAISTTGIDSAIGAPQARWGSRGGGPAVPGPRDMFWLLMTGVGGLLGVASGDHERAGSACRALLPFAGGPPEAAPRR
jgi:hypothetical protein